MDKKLQHVLNLIVGYLVLGSYNVYAALPTAPKDFTENSDDWLKGLTVFVSKIFVVGITVISATGFIIMMHSAWESFDRAREHGRWRSFAVTVSLGFTLLGITLFMATKFKDVFEGILA